MKDAISIPAESRPRQKDSMDELLAKFEYAEIKRCMDKRCREEEQAQMAVKPVGTVQRYWSPCSPNPDMPSNAYVKLDNEGKMGQELEELTSSSSSTGLNTPGQQSPPDQGIWEQGRTIANGILTAGVDSSQGGRTPSPPEQSTRTRTFADIFSTAAIQENRRLKTFNELNKPFDPGGREEKAPPWNAAVPLPFFFLERSWEASGLSVCGEAGRLFVRFLRPVCVFPNLYFSFHR